MRPGRHLATISILPVLFGCAEPDVVPTGSTVRDSSGIEIVDNPGEPGEQRLEWLVGGDPILQIGVVEGGDAGSPYQFGRIGGAIRMPDGTIVVLDGRARELRVFSETGEHLRTMGRSGPGPGEFGSPSGPWHVGGDTVAVWDGNQRTFSLFDVRSGYLGALEPSSHLRGTIIDFVGPRAVLTQSTSVTAGLGAPEEVREDRAVFELIRLDPAAAPDTVGTMNSLWVYQRPLPHTVLFLPVPYTAMASAGADRERFVLSDGIRPEIRVFEPDGTLRRIIRVGTGPALRPSDFRDEVERRLTFVEPADRPDFRRMYSGMPVPPIAPSYVRVVLAKTGEIWAEHYVPEMFHHVWPPPRRASRWTVFDPSGAATAGVALPLGFTLHEIDDETIFGVYQDQMGVEYVQRLPLER
jgi:hypothetical protein